MSKLKKIGEDHLENLKRLRNFPLVPGNPVMPKNFEQWKPYQNALDYAIDTLEAERTLTPEEIDNLIDLT